MLGFLAIFEKFTIVDFMLTIRLKLLANALGAIVSKDLEYFAYSNFLSGLHLVMGYLAI